MYADPAGRCLSYSDDEPQGLGPFTCVADAYFLLRALAAVLGFSTLLVMDAGSPPPPQMGSLGMDWGRGFSLPATLMLQVHGTDILKRVHHTADYSCVCNGQSGTYLRSKTGQLSDG